jgi:hypothetical protein
MLEMENGQLPNQNGVVSSDNNQDVFKNLNGSIVANLAEENEFEDENLTRRLSSDSTFDTNMDASPKKSKGNSILKIDSIILTFRSHYVRRTIHTEDQRMYDDL